MSSAAPSALLGQRVVVRGATESLPGAVARGLLDDQADAAEIDGTGLWAIPGVVDAHTHLAWHAFEAHDRDTDAERAAAATARSLAATLATGVTEARDAGGLTLAGIDALPAGPRPRLRLAGPMRGAEHAGRGAGHLASVVEAAIAAGSTWIKVVATGGLSAPTETVLDPVFGRDELLEIGAAARAGGARVLAHAWGGASIPWLVEAGVASIEHGIHLTTADVDALAAAGIALVPTVAIYRQTAVAETGVPAEIRDRAARAAEAHAVAVVAARDAGVAIALGTDAGTPAQHGANLAELAALVDAGLTPTEALRAATVVGARLLAEPGEAEPVGDLVLLDVDPLRTSEVTADRVVAVVQAGRLVHLNPRSPLSTAPTERPNP